MKKPAVNSKALRQGGYLAAVTAAVVALVVLVNLVMGQLPSNDDRVRPDGQQPL